MVYELVEEGRRMVCILTEGYNMGHNCPEVDWNNVEYDSVMMNLLEPELESTVFPSAFC
jgi:hypothetical protein